MLSRPLPLWAAVLPLLTINVCYLVAVGLDHLPACVPYVSGCTSVSSTGRMAPESWIFRLGMLPSALIVVLVWWHSSSILESGGRSRYYIVTLRLLGILSALSLTLYTLTLGYPGSDFRLLRRVGIDGFALSNLLAQVLFILGYRHIGAGADKNLLRLLVGTCLALPVFGIAAEIAKSMGAPRHAVNNIAAWNAFVFVCAYFAVLYYVWRHHEPT